MNIPEVAVVILNWNGKAYLQKFLPFVLASGYPKLRIIVADNASADDSVAFVRSQFPQVELILNKENFGFAGGYNAALEHVEADYFVLLNSDVEVTPGWITPVIQMMESDPHIAAAQPKLKDYARRQCFEYAGAAGGFIDQFGYPFCRGRIFDQVEEDSGQYDVPGEIFWASGAALFIKRTCWLEAGGFDADFFAHMEEIDLCWRLKNLGYKIMYYPISTVYHIGGGTLQAENPYKTYLNFRNNLFMLQKNLPLGQAVLTLFIRFWLDFISLLKFLADGKVKHARAINKAHVAFFASFGTNRKKRPASFKMFNPAGLVRKSIVWQFFGKGKKRFSDILD